MYSGISAQGLQQRIVDAGRLHGIVQDALLLSSHVPDHWYPIATQLSLLLPVLMILLHFF